MATTHTGLHEKAQKAGELARGIIEGDIPSGNLFVQNHYKWLMFIVRRKFPRISAHEDLVQEAFMIIFTKLKNGDIEKPDAVLSYLRTTAINIGYEYLRKDKKYTSAIDQDLLSIIEDAKASVEKPLEKEDIIRYVKQIMEELPTDRDREILTTFYFKDEGKPSICEKLALSSAHFDRVLHRAKKRLKELIANKRNHDDPNGDTIT
ncbi:RNA polymerase sigma factor [Marinicella sp. W31]|uniref:RNA polymerase sigma factor n=1 Tax=Marinicella sp. W31 TaxID=3023713 RepID=UPI0037566DD4